MIIERNSEIAAFTLTGTELLPKNGVTETIEATLTKTSIANSRYSIVKLTVSPCLT